MKLNVSSGNSKLGKIPNISGVPGKDCPPICKKTCAKDCYALKAFRMYPNVRKAWRGNSAYLKRDMAGYFRDLDAWLTKKRPRFFRLHVAGDIVSREHFKAICKLAKDHSNTRFLVFTKHYEAVRGSIPANLTVMVSIWEGMRPSMIPKRLRALPYAFAGDCKAFARSVFAITCPGYCETCGMCFDAAKKRIDVSFNLH